MKRIIYPLVLSLAFVVFPTGHLPAFAQDGDVAIIKTYAESYEPKPAKGSFIPQPPTVGEEVSQAISNLTKIQSQEHEKYIVLIFLRLYRYHLENAHQSYELGRDNFLTKEFYNIIGIRNYQKREFLSSSLVLCYIEINGELSKYALIAKEMKRIRKADEEIEKMLNETIREEKEREEKEKDNR